MDSRHLQRIKIVQNLFAHCFKVLQNNLPYPDDKKTNAILKKLPKIDKYIETYAPRYPLANISKTDLSILRLSIYELLYEKRLPTKVVINEAIELAKDMSGEKSYAFINAVLGKLLIKDNETPKSS
ncbi:MAG: transcription antitermination factor NusB [Actinobacteria bacterium]|nr:transcription antitermination factor NusB [Actinomycetota bacterium]